MFEVGFSEILLIFAIALLVLGPNRLPKLAADLGRWAGRARAMARQLRTQLEQEVNFDPLKEQPHGTSSAPPTTPPPFPAVQPPPAAEPAPTEAATATATAAAATPAASAETAPAVTAEPVPATPPDRIHEPEPR